MSFITSTDGYKLDHRRQYPPGTTRVYSNFTPRSTRIPNQKSVVFFGLQYFLRHFLTDNAYDTFFNRPLAEVLYQYRNMVEYYLGPDAAEQIGTDHIKALHQLRYIPLRFCALPEGTSVPLRMPMFTVENTLDEFYWLTNYIETALSAYLWLPCTSATTARRYRKLLNAWAMKTAGSTDFVQWQGHDFSFRGMESVEAAARSGAGHLLSFTGTDTIPAIELLRTYYNGAGLIGGSVPATEHAVMCAGGKEDEIETFRRLLKLYPKGILSVVSDTWDLWHVIGDILPKLKDEIMARDGRLVIRPDSGDPANIICGMWGYAKSDPAHVKGVVQALYDIFGGHGNIQGYKELDPHIGCIYGDSITEAVAEDICHRLENKGFASTNVVLGIGSYTYQYVTRDTNGFAIKATWAKINGEEHMLYKQPKTDDGTKNSARGRIVIYRGEDGALGWFDGMTEAQQMGFKNLLQPVWEDGKFLKGIMTLDQIRKNVMEGL